MAEGRSTYEVTATRKRPQDFEALVGQEFVVTTLENAIKENRIAHAYLFSGPRGVGKTSSARLLAKALNCQEGMSAHPCGKCDSCLSIARGSSVDVIEIDGASNTSVNDVRAIKEEIMFPPQSSRYKIYIIDEVHMLSGSAFNALLKTIEEPPEYIIFIFATTELQKVPATIRSRCQQFRFNLIGHENIMKCLKSAADDLDVEADEDALFWIAREAEGSMRDAYTLFDQVASFSSSHITLEKIRKKLSTAGFSAISEIVSASIAGDIKTAIEQLSSLFSQGVSAEQITRDSADFFRTLLLYKEGIRRTDILGSPLSDIPAALAEMLSREQLEAALKAFLTLYRELRYSLSPRIEIELLVSRLSSLPDLASPTELVRKLEKLKDGVAEGSIVIRQPRAAVAAKELPKTPVKEETKIAEEPEKTETKSIAEEPEEMEMASEEEKRSFSLSDIPAVSEALRKMGKGFAARYLEDTAEIKEDDGIYTIHLSKPISFNGLKNARKDLQKAIASAMGESISFELVLDREEEENSSTVPEMEKLQRFFGGSIVKTDTIQTEEERIDEHQPVRIDEESEFDTEQPDFD